ncbi:HNH endonuclease [Candidatus Nitrospira allomarina]|uniref:HNH endonuclease n=1 Tax=Candidatus Nitrospira allomarina TaxID=3020900 RepID=A0AA96G9P9_9BACT|nr:HNH endonuclease [Candidatus Nitrospira allomarina]WNM57486.1 HNH endonuclease [Candidatus Nitrospira allomarina]
MRFGAVQKINLGTSDGAYSLVTEREHVDSQITLTDYEAEIVLSHFGKDNIHVGNVQSNKFLSSKLFRLFPSGKPIKLNVVYPKPEKTELRLYISSRAGFKPKGGDIWFMFLKDDSIWIGAMAEPLWRNKASEVKADESDDIYQREVNDTDRVRIAKLKGRDIYARDRNIAVSRMKLSGYTCEFDPSHKLFSSRFTKNPYLEAHHLIPIGLQGSFSQSLDTIHNIFCLCPYCHRAVHNAENSVARSILACLAEKRPVHKKFGLTVPQLFGLYAVEEID